MRHCLPIAALAAALGVAGCAPAPAPPGERPNLLLVTIDTLRADRLSAWGYGAETSPHLDRLAASGVRFSRALSAGSCTAPSHASILTGLYPSFHSIGGYNGRYPLADDAVTLAERLRDAGYATAAVVSNPVLARRVRLDQGFGSYDDELGDVEPNRPWKQQHAGTAARKAAVVVANLEPPWFFWLHLQDPHGPYVPPPSFEGLPGAPAEEADATVLPVGNDQSGYRAIPVYQQLGDERQVGSYLHGYAREVAYADRELGGLLAALEGAGRLGGTLIAVTSDHGEALGEDEFWFSHGHSSGWDQVHVPLILAGDAAGRELGVGRVVDDPVSNAALFATLLEAAGLTVEPAPGRIASLWPLLAGGRAEPVFVDSLGQVGVAQGDSFLRRDRVAPEDRAFWDGPNPTTGGFWKPLGTSWRSLAGEPASGAADEELAAVLDAFQARADAAAAEQARSRQERGDGPPLTEEERRRLRALGYAG